MKTLTQMPIIADQRFWMTFLDDNNNANSLLMYTHDLLVNQLITKIFQNS